MIQSQYYFQFLDGIENVFIVFCVSCLLGTALGLLVAIIKTSARGLAYALASAYTTAIRGIPELLIILIVYFGGTLAVSAVVGRYVEVDAMTAGVVALTVVFGAYAAEAFRGAINAIPRGQSEAAMSLGLNRWQRWCLIVIPQMVPIALPAFGNICISLIKDTSLISVVGLVDIMRVANVGAGSLRAPLSFYLAASAIYLVLTSLTLLSFRLLENRASMRRVRG
ncbi:MULTISPECIES: ABC transporter permease subunit [unclassified Rhizobium]